MRLSTGLLATPEADLRKPRAMGLGLFFNVGSVTRKRLVEGLCTLGSAA
jgi:hypothetical protein